MDLGRVVEVTVLVLYVAAGLFFVVRDLSVTFAATPSASVSPSASAVGPSARPSSAAPSIAPTPSAVATIAATPTPTATADPLAVSAYVNDGRRFAALVAPVGYTVTSPIAGTARIAVYQLLGGEIRVGSNIPSEPFFPYVTITSADRRVILRPGALDRDVQLLVKDGDTVAVGSPLFKILGDGASSWRTFYDRALSAQVVASFAAFPSGAELDPVPLFRH